jgi:hypothetical protein
MVKNYFVFYYRIVWNRLRINSKLLLKTVFLTSVKQALKELSVNTVFNSQNSVQRLDSTLKGGG